MSLLIPPEIAAINDVIKAARDSARAWSWAADMEGVSDAADMRAKSKARTTLAEQLCDQVRDLDAQPPAENTQGEIEVIETLWSNLRASLSGDPDSAAQELCKSAEDRLSAAIDAALAEEALPPAAASTINQFIR
ncbi:hypothetical protein [Hwanghaeella sp. 1Z406]|jgi:uncharacterized protein (TIGR02284 family)|uniref:hypothetical protein n=1 Tax=Hwanghaeella sp. 1Z406 TaxID=3402811 RepID=UPI0026A477A4|tara:strand:- start:1064 stop:1468 length:405 start_codon:yes stop_codon:yes gene_type:complete